jgi:drug/metabolite transporter (DMT)-like permease
MPYCFKLLLGMAWNGERVPIVTLHTQRRHYSAASMRLLLILLFVIWANAFTAIKYLREVFTPKELVLARFLPVAAFCTLYLLAVSRRRRESIDILTAAPLRLIAMGLSGVAAYNFFLYLGQSEVKPGAAALLTTLAPLFTLFLAVVFLKERVPLRTVLGIMIAFAGLYIVVRWGRVGLGRITGISHPELRYVLITALAPLSWSIYTIIGKNLLGKTSPLTVTYLTIIVGTMPFVGAANGHFFHTFATLTATHWLALAHLSILCTLVGFWIWFTALARLPTTSVASFVYLNPPFAALFGSLFFHEEITGFFLLGSAVVLAGLYLAQGERESNTEENA